MFHIAFGIIVHVDHGTVFFVCAVSNQINFNAFLTQLLFIFSLRFVHIL